MTFTPDWTSPPGDTITDALDELGLTRADLARATGLDAATVDRLCTGAVAIDTTIAEALARVLGSPPAFWLVDGEGAAVAVDLAREVFGPEQLRVSAAANDRLRRLAVA